MVLFYHLFVLFLAGGRTFAGTLKYYGNFDHPVFDPSQWRFLYE